LFNGSSAGRGIFEVLNPALGWGEKKNRKFSFKVDVLIICPATVYFAM
jgi:hypothetical protein